MARLHLLLEKRVLMADELGSMGTVHDLLTGRSARF
jgi:hypothetical protein